MQIDLETNKLMNGRYQAVAALRNPKVLSGGKPMGIMETCVVRPTQEAAEAVAVLDLMLAGLPESL